MAQPLWTVEIELSITRGATVNVFVQTMKRKTAPHENNKGNVVGIPVEIGDDKNTTTRSITGKVVDVYGIDSVALFAHIKWAAKLEDSNLSLSDIEDRLIATGWRKVL